MAYSAEQQFEQESWVAHLQLGFQRANNRTVLTETKRIGPLTIQRPFYPEKDICHIYILHPPGGIVGGDVIHLNINVGKNANALITTPGATKFYRSLKNEASYHQTISLKEKSCLEWFPLENIYFPGAIVNMDTTLKLEKDAKLAIWDFQCFGRPSVKEEFSKGFIDIRFNLKRVGIPMINERLRVDKNLIRFSSLLRGAPVCATMVINHANQNLLERARDYLFIDENNFSGATRIEDMLIIRYLGHSTEIARCQFTRIWAELRKEVFGRTPHLPRVWKT